ncbi:MAG: hypothetical protein IT368_18570, partial [Candidatus Hydrogenedentes bacterium]|nr:hypothetical protein [Candidatus Hydrogenedentota bacterium]
MDRWAAVQASRPALASPYFCPQFTHAVAQVRDDAFVLVDESNGSPLFFPFQRSSLGRGRPIGGALNDCQGIVAADDHFDLAEVLASARLQSFEYDHVVAGQAPFAPWHRHHDVSPRMDLADGYEAYLADRKAAGTELISQILRKRRKLEREHGPLRFDLNDPDSRAFEKLREWKSAQYRASGLTDVLSFPWT